MKSVLASLVKSALASFLSVVLGVVTGYAAFGALGLATGLEYGRNPLPIAICAAVVLLATGYTYGRWLHASILGCVLGLAAYVWLVYATVAYLGGSVGGIFYDWFFATLAVTLVPWVVGLILSRFGKKKRTT